MRERIPHIPSDETNNEEERDPRITSRRSFIKAGVLGLASIAAGKEAVEQLAHLIEGNDSPENKTNREEASAMDEEEAGALFNLDQDTEITLATIKRLKAYWKKRYEDSRDKERDLVLALQRLQRLNGELGFNVDQKIKTIFTEANVPPALRFVAIPESYWNTRKRSPAGARGAYQLTAATARTFGLNVNLRTKPPIDERTDPVKSAKAAAKLFEDLLARMQRDSLLALSGYNGGLVWRYFAALEKDKLDGLSYEGFVGHVNEWLQRARETARHATSWNHRIREGDTLSSLSRLYGVPVKELMAANSLASDTLRAEETLRIPITSQRRRLRLYRKLTRGISENINYVPKVLAVIEVLKKRGIT